MLNIGVDTTEFNRALAEKMKSAKRGAVAELNQQLQDQITKINKKNKENTP